MTGTIKRTTDRYNLRIPIFDAPGWGREMERNMDIIDAAIFIATGFGSILGVWINSTSYDEGSRVIDETDGTLWLAKITHTSNSSGSFAADRAANPTYWEQITNTSIYRGTWASSVVYNENEFVSDGYRYGIVTSKYTSGVSYDADVVAGNIVTLIDLTTAVTTASTAKDDAVTAKNDAVAAQTAAENARDTATTKANNAANSATTATNAANAASADATQVTTDKGIVLGYKNDASNAKIAAEAAQTAAESARDQTLSTLDSFDDRYLGAKAADPTTDNDGNALIGGALYYNTTNGVMMVYTGASWVSAYVDGNNFYNKVQSDARFLGINAKAADADKLDNKDSSAFAQLDANNIFTGVNTLLDENPLLRLDRTASGGFAFIHSIAPEMIGIGTYNEATTAFKRLTITYSNGPDWDGNKLWHAGNDGVGSGLDADKLDGVDGANYARTDINAAFSGTLSAGVQITATHSAVDRYGYFSVSNSAGQRGGFFGFGNGSTTIGIYADVAVQFSFDGFTGVDFGGATLTSGGNGVAQFYTGVSVNETNYPVGQLIVVQTSGISVDRNKAHYVAYSGTAIFTFNTGTAPLSGTWRSRGSTGTGAFLMQRTA